MKSLLLLLRLFFVKGRLVVWLLTLLLLSDWCWWACPLLWLRFEWIGKFLEICVQPRVRFGDCATVIYMEHPLLDLLLDPHQLWIIGYGVILEILSLNVIDILTK